MRNTYNASTITPADPTDTLGDITPSTPQAAPPARRKCGGVGAILLMVVAAVVVWKLAPYLIAKFSTMMGTQATVGGITKLMAAGTLGASTVPTAAIVAGSATAAAVGSVVSQAIGVATGIQEKFSWNQVGMAFISGGVGAGMGNVGGSGMGAAFVRGAASSAVTQGIGVALGMQDKFSWAAVAAAGVTSAAARGLSMAGSEYADIGGARVRIQGTSWMERANHGLGDALGGTRFAGQMADAIVGAGVGFASAVAGAAAQSLIDGSDFGDNVMAALPAVAANLMTSGIMAMLENACFVAGTQVQTVHGRRPSRI